MHLILMRHGSCSPGKKEQRDSDRELTDQGKNEVLTAVSFLSAIGIAPQVILSSPFRRSMQTAELIAENMPAKLETEASPALMPGAGTQELLRAIQNRTEATGEDWIMVVCHEPDISSNVKQLIGQQCPCQLPVYPGDIVGLQLDCIGGTPSCDLMFYFSPVATRRE